jgi:hypothetical protein
MATTLRTDHMKQGKQPITALIYDVEASKYIAIPMGPALTMIRRRPIAPGALGNTQAGIRRAGFILQGLAIMKYNMRKLERIEQYTD